MRNVMYRFYVDRGQCRVIYPDDVNIEYTPETGQKFFRERIGSKIVFVGTDYDYIMQQIEQDFGHKFEVLIRRSDDGGATWYDWHQGQFHATDCVINTNDKKITVQPATDDAYTEILAGLEKEYNLVEITQQVENVVLTKRPLLQVYVLGDSKVTCILSGMVWEQDATQEYDDERMVDHYNFNLDSMQRELNVTGSGLPAAVGLYYGTLAYSSSTEKFEGTLHPKESTGYYIYCGQVTRGAKPIAIGVGLVQIKRIADDAVMYEYSYIYNGGDSENSDNIDFTFDAVTGSGVMSGEMATYRLYTRIMCDVPSYSGQPTKEIPADDIVPNNRNYRRCTMNAPMTPVPLSVNQTQWDGYYTPAGVWQADVNFSCRHYVVTAGKSYYFSGRHRDDSMVPFVLWFTANGDFISAERYGTNYVNEYYEQPITAPAGAAFCYLNVDNSFMAYHNVGYYTASSARIGYMSGNTSVNPTQWGRTPTGEYYAPPVVPGAKLNPVGRTLWRYTSMWVAFNTNVNEEPLQKQFTLRDAYSLTTTIQALLAQVAPSISFGNTAVFSQFLFGANPVVSGETIGTLYITQKTNLLNGEYSQPAMNAPITLGQVLNMLKHVYGLYWFIENNNLRIEHISFFENGGAYTGSRQVGADLTQMVNPRSGKTWAFMTGEWQYSKADMMERYEYQWMDESTEMFRGQPIEVVGTFIERGKIEDITISGFNADIDYILMNPSDVSEDGFAIMAAVSSGGQMVVPMVNMGTQQQPLIVQNGRMAMTYVQPRYLIYNMPSWALKVNGGNMAAKSIQKGRTQTVKIPCGVNDLDLKKLVKTEIGEGEITKVTMPLLSRVAQVSLGFQTYGDEPTPPTPPTPPDPPEPPDPPTPVLPYDAEVEYLESTGTAYIDTGITPTLSYSVEMEFYLVSPLSSESASATMFGTLNGWNKNTFMVACTPSVYRIYNCWGNKNTSYTDQSYVTGIVGNWHTLVFRDKKILIDDTQIGNAVASPSGNPVGSIHLFCAKNYADNTLYGIGSTKRIRRYKIYDADSQLVMNLKSVRVGTTGYMYDEISGRLFGKSGTDDFIVGSDKN